ncbi:MAG: hypothetical protein H6Q24_1211, partial [Bacteroidetes bacterium]|nr:hypothetical protein [Bacteroidota bacterium]
MNMKTNHFMNSLKALILGGMIIIATACQEDIPVSGLSLDKETAIVSVGATVVILPVVDPVDATNDNVLWSSDDITVATVADGVVTGVALGTVAITAASAENPALTATCEVIVVPSTGQVINISGDITADTKWYAQAKY